MLLRSPAVITVQLERITGDARKSSIRLWNSFHPAALMTLGEPQLMLLSLGQETLEMHMRSGGGRWMN